MAKEYTESDVDRRSFIKAVMATAVAATATGTTAALILKEEGATTITLPPPTLPEPPPAMVAADLGLNELRSQLTAALAENTRLRVQLSSAESQLELASRMAADQDVSESAAWQQQFDEANVRAASLGEQVNVLQGLIELFDQLETVDMTAVVGGGLAAVSGVLGGLVDEVPAVSEGIESGKQALDEFEEQLPQIQDGRLWLSNQLEVVSQAYDRLERALQNTVKATGSFLHLLSEWFQDILKWLPFGIGNKASTIMEAIAGLVGEIPDTLEGTRNKIAGPLDLWLEVEQGETRLQRRMIKPVREKALDQAAQAVSQVQTLDSVYQSQLREPAKSAAEQQQSIRERIAEYRQSYQV